VRDVDGEPLIRPLQHARTFSQRRTKEVAKALTEEVVPDRRSRHRHDLAIDELVPLLGLALEAKLAIDPNEA
jgi:hypothetical protein